MEMNLQFDASSRRFARRIATMIDSRLIWYKHYYRWADHLIATLDEPPNWILEIATIKYYPDAVAAVNRFVYSEPFEVFDDEQCSDEIVACLFLRCESGATSWATFLSTAGSFTDAHGGRRSCEYFYTFLNDLEDREYAPDVELRQRAEIRSEFSAAIAIVQPLYDMFMGYFREYVANEV